MSGDRMAWVHRCGTHYFTGDKLTVTGTEARELRAAKVAK